MLQALKELWPAPAEAEAGEVTSFVEKLLAAAAKAPSTAKAVKQSGQKRSPAGVL